MIVTWQLLGVVLATALSGPAEASGGNDAGRRLGDTIRAEMAAHGPIITPEDRALIAAKCGYTPEEGERGSVHMTDGTLICTNGRRVADDETRAMSKRISARARDHADRALRSAEVAKAKAAVAREAAARAMERVRARHQGRTSP